MQPALGIDLGKVSFHRFYQLFLPFLPGGTLLIGLVLAHPDFIRGMTVALGLGRYSRMGAIAFGSYVVGLLLYGFSYCLCSLLERVLFTVMVKLFRPKRENVELSKRAAWRRAAANMLGPDIIPRWPGTGGGEDVSLALAEISDDRWDHEWNDWYNGLQDYFYKVKFRLPVDFQLLWHHLQAIGWAALFIYFKTPLRGHWSVLVVIFTVISYALVFRLIPAYAYWNSDPFVYWQFLSNILREDRRRRIGVERKAESSETAGS